MLVAHITDTHISKPDKSPEVTYQTSSHLARAVAHIRGLTRRPDAVLITGDLVDEGSAEEYARFKELIAPLEMPVYLIPGNHDEREALRAAFGAAGYFPASGFLQYTVEHLPVRFVALDTNKPMATGGELCAERLAWLDRTLAEQPARPTVVFMHHPPFRTGVHRMDDWGLDNADAFGAVIARHPQVERILCGHLHRPIQRRYHGTIAQTGPSTAHQIGLDLSDNRATLALVMEPPACLLHYWTGEDLVTHTSYIDPFEVRDVVDFTKLGM
jgi:3',5'-cyclic AMP phosphodiesterase CpdA